MKKGTEGGFFLFNAGGDGEPSSPDVLVLEEDDGGKARGEGDTVWLRF